MKISSKTVLSLCAAITIAGCTSPDWMPNGYTYNDQTPISSPPKTFGWKNKVQAQSDSSIRYDLTSTVKGVAADIAQSLDPKLPAGRPLYIAPKTGVNGLSNVFDLGLREAFMARGFELSNKPLGAINLIYSVARDSDYSSLDLDNPYDEKSVIKVYRDEDAFLFLVDYPVSPDYVIKEFRLQPLPKDDVKTIYMPLVNYPKQVGDRTLEDGLNKD